MLEIGSPSGNTLCGGISRRRAIEIGALGVFGLSLPGLLRSEARAANGSSERVDYASKRSVILIWQHGGPSQLDTFDMKPLAPAEVRGPYQSINSSLPGLDVGELCVEQAKVMDKCSVIRSFPHGNSDHWAAAHWMLTGRLGATASIDGCLAGRSQLLGPRQKGTLASGRTERCRVPVDRPCRDVETCGCCRTGAADRRTVSAEKLDSSVDR